MQLMSLSKKKQKTPISWVSTDLSSSLVIISMKYLLQTFHHSLKVTSLLTEQCFLFTKSLGVRNQEGENVYKVGYTWSTTKLAAGTTVHYYHKKYIDADKVFIPGPTTQPLTVYVSYVFMHLITDIFCPYYATGHISVTLAIRT